MTTQAPPTARPGGRGWTAPPSCGGLESQSPREQRSLEGRGLALTLTSPDEEVRSPSIRPASFSTLWGMWEPVTTHRGPEGVPVGTVLLGLRPAGGCTARAEDFFTPAPDPARHSGTCEGRPRVSAALAAGPTTDPIALGRGDCEAARALTSPGAAGLESRPERAAFHSAPRSPLSVAFVQAYLFSPRVAGRSETPCVVTSSKLCLTGSLLD